MIIYDNIVKKQKKERIKKWDLKFSLHSCVYLRQ